VQEYLGIAGLPQFCQLARKLAFGDCPAAAEGRIATVQSLSGTGSLRVAADFLSSFYSCKTILVCQPTWGNHNKIFPKGGLTIVPYRYYDPRSRGLDIEGMLQDLGRAETGAIVLLHACAHNPTGVDPTQEQWGRILQVVQQRSLYCLFDSAYQVRCLLAHAAVPFLQDVHQSGYRVFGSRRWVAQTKLGIFPPQ
jgi:aspartate aminotransferase, cytoplasmic